MANSKSSTLPMPLHSIEGGKGFVHQKHGGLARQGAGKGDALLHAARKLIRATVVVAIQPDGLRCCAAPLLAFCLTDAGDFETESAKDCRTMLMSRRRSSIRWGACAPRLVPRFRLNQSWVRSTG